MGLWNFPEEDKAPVLMKFLDKIEKIMWENQRKLSEPFLVLE